MVARKCVDTKTVLVLETTSGKFWTPTAPDPCALHTLLLCHCQTLRPCIEDPQTDRFSTYVDWSKLYLLCLHVSASSANDTSSSDDEVSSELASSSKAVIIIGVIITVALIVAVFCLVRRYKRKGHMYSCQRHWRYTNDTATRNTLCFNCNWRPRSIDEWTKFMDPGSFCGLGYLCLGFLAYGWLWPQKALQDHTQSQCWSVEQIAQKHWSG